MCIRDSCAGAGHGRQRAVTDGDPHGDRRLPRRGRPAGGGGADRGDDRSGTRRAGPRRTGVVQRGHRSPPARENRDGEGLRQRRAHEAGGEQPRAGRSACATGRVRALARVGRRGMRRSPRLRAVAVDAGLVALALLDAALSARVDQTSRAALGASVLAALALAVRRRWPYATFALTLPGLLIASVLIAPLVALYTLAATSRNRRPVLVCAVIAL